MYGQSGTGKTYTMGTSQQPAAQPSAEGLVPRLVSKIFASLPSADGSHRVTLTIVEIYRERIRCVQRDAALFKCASSSNASTLQRPAVPLP